MYKYYMHIIRIILCLFTIGSAGATAYIDGAYKESAQYGLNKIDKSEDGASVKYVVQEILAPKYDYIDYFRDRYAIARIGDEDTGKYGLIDDLGAEAAPFAYDQINQLEAGYISVRRGDKWGVVAIDGSEIIPTIYDWVYLNVEDGFATVRIAELTEQTMGLVELATGRVVVPTGKYSNIGSVGEKRGAAYPIYTDSYLYGNLSALIDIVSGDELTPFKYVTINDFHEGYALAIKEDRINNGYIDINGVEITEFIYDQNSGYFINGLAPVCHNDKWGIINTDGDYVLSPKYNSLSQWHRFYGDPEVKFITASVDDKFALIDRNAKEVIPPI